MKFHKKKIRLYRARHSYTNLTQQQALQAAEEHRKFQLLV